MTPRRQEHCCKTRMQNNIASNDGELIFFFCGGPAVYMKLKNEGGRKDSDPRGRYLRLGKPTF